MGHNDCFWDTIRLQTKLKLQKFKLRYNDLNVYIVDNLVTVNLTKSIGTIPVGSFTKAITLNSDEKPSFHPFDYDGQKNEYKDVKIEWTNLHEKPAVLLCIEKNNPIDTSLSNQNGKYY